MGICEVHGAVTGSTGRNKRFRRKILGHFGHVELGSPVKQLGGDFGKYMFRNIKYKRQIWNGKRYVRDVGTEVVIKLMEVIKVSSVAAINT